LPRFDLEVKWKLTNKKKDPHMAKVINEVRPELQIQTVCEELGEQRVIKLVMRRGKHLARIQVPVTAQDDHKTRQSKIDAAVGLFYREFELYSQNSRP